jgi:homoserine O-acetyltransferase
VGLDAIIDLPLPWTLYHGDTLTRARVAFRLIGPDGAPVVAALGGISAHRVVAGRKGEAWWTELVGSGLALDTERYRVLGIDYIGGTGDSSSHDEAGAPRATAATDATAGADATRAAAEFPPVSAYDQAAALAAVVRHLALPSLHAIVGASYGGMVALAFAKDHPELVQRLLILSAADRPRALATAWRSVQRHIVREALVRGEGRAGLAIARALAMTTYRSSDEFRDRFGGPPVRIRNRFRFPVEEYLLARGARYVEQYRPDAFLCLSESIDLFAIDAATVRTPATLVAVRQDQLVPVADVMALQQRLGGRARLVELDSMFGHDAFLKEGALLKPIFEQALTEAH